MREFDDILPFIGAFGRYQKTQFVLLCVPAGIVAAIIAFHSTFVSGTPDHWCTTPALLNTNLTTEQRKALSIPRSDKAEAPYERCVMYDVNYEKLLNYSAKWPPEANARWDRKSCQYGWEYDKSSYGETLVTKVGYVIIETAPRLVQLTLIRSFF